MECLELPYDDLATFTGLYLHKQRIQISRWDTRKVVPKLQQTPRHKDVWGSEGLFFIIPSGVKLSPPGTAATAVLQPIAYSLIRILEDTGSNLGSEASCHDGLRYFIQSIKANNVFIYVIAASDHMF